MTRNLGDYDEINGSLGTKKEDTGDHQLESLIVELDVHDLNMADAAQSRQQVLYLIDSAGRAPHSGHMMAYTSARYDDSPVTGSVLIGRNKSCGPKAFFFFAVQLDGSEDRLVVIVESSGLLPVRGHSGGSG